MMPNKVEYVVAVAPRHPDEPNSHGVIRSPSRGVFWSHPRDLEGNPEGKTIGRNEEEP
jgi:hypothetical protein